MSERGEVAVDLPLTNPLMSETEKRQLVRTAIDAARALLAQSGGRLLGLKAIEPAALDSGPGLHFVFAVEAPESAFHQRKSFAVDGRHA